MNHLIPRKQNAQTTVVGIVVGEASGDLLGAGLMRALKKRLPNIRFIGIGGPNMVSEGFENLFPMERLAVMGITEVVMRLPELLKIRKRMIAYFADYKPDLFIGIDAPDFNLELESALRRCAIKTVHYVSPSVWAWRQDRISTIKRSVDLLLALFPFEADFYRQHDVPVEVVGHPLADKLPLESQMQTARATLGIDQNQTLLAVMPGSRKGEIDYIAPEFVGAIYKLHKKYPEINFWFPSISERRQSQLKTVVDKVLQKHYGSIDLPIRYSVGNAREIMAASNLVLLASGTATLEAMLLKKPMVVAYKWGWLTHAVISKMVKTPYVSLPNLLAGKALIPELIQRQCNANRIAEVVADMLKTYSYESLIEQFTQLHKCLRKNADEKAAEALLPLLV